MHWTISIVNYDEQFLLSNGGAEKNRRIIGAQPFPALLDFSLMEKLKSNQRRKHLLWTTKRKRDEKQRSKKVAI